MSSSPSAVCTQGALGPCSTRSKSGTLSHQLKPGHAAVLLRHEVARLMPSHVFMHLRGFQMVAVPRGLGHVES